MNLHPTRLKENRRRLARLVTESLRQVARIIRIEQDELHRRFPDMAGHSPPVDLNPQVILDYTRSDEYRRAVEAYVSGTLDVNLLVRIMESLERIAPLEFPRR